MKHFAKWAVGQLPFRTLYEVFYQSGRALGITGYETAGQYGTFCGSLVDQSVMKEYLRNRTFSPVIGKIFTEFFVARGGGTFFDVGANIGLVTVPVARNPSVRCVSFEPDPTNFAHLRANVMANCPLGNVELFNAAVAAERGTLKFTRSEYNSGDHRLAPDGDLTVETVTLDDFAPNTLPLAIKIDCQGAEPLIIEGGRAILAKAELVVCEFWPFGMRRMGTRVETVVDFVRDNFLFAQVLRHGQSLATPAPVAEAVAVMQRMIADGGEYTQADLVLTR